MRDIFVQNFQKFDLLCV